MQDRFRHAQRFTICFHLMHADDAGTVFASVGGEGHGGPETVGGGVGVEHFADHGFARDADEQGTLR